MERHHPIDASSGKQNRHRLTRAGNRRINRMLHIMAIGQLNDTEGPAYYQRKLAAGKTQMEAIWLSNGGCPTSSTAHSSTTRKAGDSP
jgi:hypothetical protein